MGSGILQSWSNGRATWGSYRLDGRFINRCVIVEHDYGVHDCGANANNDQWYLFSSDDTSRRWIERIGLWVTRH